MAEETKDITTMIADLRAMVNDTINPENGLKSITGSSMNLAMNATIDAIEEAAKTGGGGGGNAATMKAYLPVTPSMAAETPSEAQKEANIKVYNAIKNAQQQGLDVPFFTIDFIMEGETRAIATPLLSMYSEHGVPSLMSYIYMVGEFMVFAIFEDGSINLAAQS